MMSEEKTTYWQLIEMPVFIFLFLLAIELVLEVRHLHAGYQTLILTPLINVWTADDAGKADVKASQQVMVDGDYRFRSLPVNEDKPANGIRLWIASASHAHSERLPLGTIFPNKSCELLSNSGIPCDVLNASLPGLNIPKNVEWLEALGGKYRPDYAFFYQQSVEILEAQAVQPTEKSSALSLPLISFDPVRKLMQSSSIYPLVNQYLGGTTLLNGPIPDTLKSSAQDNYRQHVEAFIAVCRSKGIKPVLLTFATSHTAENLSAMPYDEWLAFVKYEHKLSPVGWVNTVKDWNKLLRSVAEKENVPLIDLEPQLAGRPEFFVDFVHFNSEGHQVIAQNIARFVSAQLAGQVKS